ncbi:hypothetical protein FRC17_008456 [Serendipita sp. 399]|nr:hypothetical protein FRC17_008456 [Serendipita sp. 399]
MRPSNSPGVLGRNGTVASLSSAVASSRAATQRELAREIERDRTLILASPATPYTLSNHSRPPLSHHDSRGALRPTTSPRLEHPPRNSSQNDTSYRPPHLGHAHSYSHESSGHSSLRRSRRPSSDDLASAAGNKRIKTTDNGNYIRVSGDNGVTDRGPYTRDGYDTRPSLSSNSHRSYGGYPNADMAEHDAQGYAPKSATSTRMASAEHTRASPLDRRLGGGRIEEEEEFPSPLRSYASPAGTPTVTENGNGIPKIKPSPLREQYKSGPPSASIPGPDEEHANSLEAHKALMELGDDEDSMAHSQRSSLRRTGSHAATQDVDEMLAEVTGDGSEERGEDPSRLSSKARYRASTSTVTPNPGGTISSFALPAGQRTDVSVPETLLDSRAPSPPVPTLLSSVAVHSPFSSLPSSLSIVFRKTDFGDMKPQSFSRSPEASGHRASNSGSFSTSSLVSPSGNGLVHMQFLPPHSGPPMPKKIYHTKNTGQVIGSQNLATMSSGTLDPSYVAPKQGAQATSYTIDGLPKRTCKQCGQPGRYRDNKCVEKWGPGPQGPEDETGGEESDTGQQCDGRGCAATPIPHCSCA